MNSNFYGNFYGLWLRREWSRHWRLLGGLSFVLVLGFLGPLLSGLLRENFTNHFIERSQEFIGAEIVVSALRPFDDKEKQTIVDTLGVTHLSSEMDLLTVVFTNNRSTMVELRAIDEEFPLRGQFSWYEGQFPSASLEKGEVWIAKSLLERLGLDEGVDVLRLGRSEFRVAGVFSSSPGLQRFTSAFAPRVFITKEALDDTGLNTFGAQVFHRLYLDGVSNELDEEVFSKDLRWTLSTDEQAGMGRFFNFFQTYLSVASLFVFLISWLSAYYLSQTFLRSRLQNVSLVTIFGGSIGNILAFYSFQFVLLFVLAFLTAALLSYLGLLFIGPALAVLFERPDLEFTFEWEIVFSFAFVLMLSFASFLLPFWVRARSLKPDISSIHQEQGRFSYRMETLFAMPCLVVFLIALMAVIGDFGLVWRIFSALLGFLVLVAGIVRMLQWLIGKISCSWTGWKKIVLLNLSRPKLSGFFAILVLSFCSLIIHFFPHVIMSIRGELQTGEAQPSLFLFNIPEAQIEDVSDWLAALDLETRYESPMVVARLVAVNGVDVDEDSEFSRRPVRISYRDTLIESEEFYAGARDFSLRQVEEAGLAGVSVEERFADRNGLYLGDILSFEVHGFPIEGQIRQLRRVRWTDFHPNFFIVFQTGVLEDEPKTYLLNVFMDAESSNISQAKVVKGLSENFPDVSIVDIESTIAQVIALGESLIFPVEAVAFVVTVLCFFILVFIVIFSLERRGKEFEIYSLYSPGEGYLQRMIGAEIIGTFLLAFVLGASIAFGFAFWVVTNQFDMVFVADIGSLVISGSIWLVLTILCAYWSVRGKIVDLR